MIALALDQRSDLLSLSKSCKALRAVTQSLQFQAAWLHRWEPDTCLLLAVKCTRHPPANILKQLIEIHGVDVNQSFGTDSAPDAQKITALHFLCMLKCFTDAMGDAMRCVNVGA